MRWLLSWLTFTTLSCALFAAYFGFTVYQLYKIIDPQFIDVHGPTLDPLWEQGEVLYAECYLSPRSDWKTSDFRNAQVLRVGDFSQLSFDWKDNERFTELDVSYASLLAIATQRQPRQQKEPEAVSRRSALHLWNSLRTNSTVFLHVHVTKQGASADPSAVNYDRLKTVHQSNPLVKFAPRQNPKNATYLLEEYISLHPTQEAESDASDEEKLSIFELPGEDPALSAPFISYWKPHMAIRLVTDFKRFPYQEIPPLVYNNLRYEQLPDQSWKYMPSLYLEDMGQTMDKLLPLNRSITSMPLKITYEPMSYARWQVLLTMELALQSQESMGFAAQDLDSLRSMIADTNPYLLAITMTVSMLHILFDWLAFKNDISYWRKKDNDMVGISLRSMVISLVSQTIVRDLVRILLYLLDEDATLLIVAPQAIGGVLQVWKVFKVLKARTHKAEAQAAMQQTRQVDEMATNHMMFVLLPLILGYSTYSVLYKQHLSWYGWVLGSLTGAVYAFGFIMMMPQLVINYKLKSVAHLQWRYLIYRALNTFIDDLFAFIMPMPTMHRISCFRDDIIFFIYLYQRWIYPVDRKRVFDEDDGTADAAKTESDPSHQHQE